MVESQDVKSAARSLAVIEYVARRMSASFTDVVADLQLPRSSAHGLLRTLQAAGWLRQDPQSRLYSLGLRAWQVGQQYTGHRELADVAGPLMKELAQRSGETVQLALLDGVENVYVAISQSPNPMRLASSVGMRLPAYATGIGKALLSQLDEGEAERRLRAAPLARMTANTVTDVEELLHILAEVRRSGYAVDDQEYILGCRCVALPLTSTSEGTELSALSLTMPTFRSDQDWPGSALGALRITAARIRSAMSLSPTELDDRFRPELQSDGTDRARTRAAGRTTPYHPGGSGGPGRR